MTMTKNRDHIFGRYVLGLARGDERASIEHGLVHDPVLKAKIECMERRLVLLDLAAEIDTPPSDLFAAVMKEIGAGGPTL
jgi:anti-sigma-K factor RskA